MSALLKHQQLIDNNRSLQTVTTSFCSASNSVWCRFKKNVVPVFTEQLLQDFNAVHESLDLMETPPLAYVLASEVPGVFNYGGDLRLFRKLIEDKNEQGLYKYMKESIDLLYSFHTSRTYERIALVQGNAFGGGFEAVLSCDHIIAEKQARFGFPERMFNLFPGMGAYSYLVRRIEPVKARKMIMSAKTYTAEEMYELGVVDQLVDTDNGNSAVLDHIHHFKRYKNAYSTIQKIAENLHPVSYEELLFVGDEWVKAAMQLSKSDLALMKRLEISQRRQHDMAD